MKASLLVPALVAVIATTACGNRSSYKSKVGGVRTTKAAVDARVVNKPAAANIEQSALDILAADTYFQQNKGSDASKLMVNSIRGMNLVLTSQNNAQQMTLNIVERHGDECSIKKVAERSIPERSITLPIFDDNKIVRCIDKSCRQILVVLKEQRQVTVGELELTTSVMQDGVMAVLLEKDSRNVYNPLQTTSKSFYQALNTEKGLASCIEEAKRDIEKRKKNEQSANSARPLSPINEGVPDETDGPDSPTVNDESPAVVAPAAPATAAPAAPKEEPKVENDDEDGPDSETVPEERPRRRGQQRAAPRAQTPAVDDEDGPDSQTVD